MNRREFIQCAAVLAAGGSSFPSQWAMSVEQTAFLRARPDYIDSATPKLFTPAQRAAVSAIAEQVIPANDTPGAIDAGAPRFIELMVSDWFTVAERQLFMIGLADLQQCAGGAFEKLSVRRQLQLLEELEDAADDDAWYDFGNFSRIWASDAPFICQIKELTVLGFMLSEVGGTQFFRENPMGKFEGDVPREPEAPAWASEGPLVRGSGEVIASD